MPSPSSSLASSAAFSCAIFVASETMSPTLRTVVSQPESRAASTAAKRTLYVPPKKQKTRPQQADRTLVGVML